LNWYKIPQNAKTVVVTHCINLYCLPLESFRQEDKEIQWIAEISAWRRIFAGLPRETEGAV
jgi:hypothetical protein